jgi:hypothetical protein
VGTTGHNSFEVFLQGGPYGTGKWVLLDHDLSTVIFNPTGGGLLSIAEVQHDFRRLTDRRYRPERQQGWLVCGLHPGDGGVYNSFRSAEYFAGYSGPPPMVNLRRGESLRRYLEPGLEDGKTFVFWGRNYNTGGIPGPERSHTWVNQPEKMHGSREGAGYRPGQARFANALYTYQPDFASGDYREGAIDESDGRVTFEFHTPYIIAATPPDNSPWGIYQPGCRNGLVIEGQAGCPVSISTDRGQTWSECGRLPGRLDATDLVKGRRQYWVRFGAGAQALRGTGLKLTTVCQANSSVLPRLKDGGAQVRFAASGRSLVSAGPNLPQAQAHVVAGGFDSPKVTLELGTPRGEPALALYAAAHVRSSNPPSPDVEYRIDYSLDQGRTWLPLVNDWRITRRGEEPPDFWSQSFCWGSRELETPAAGPVQVRFTNTGGKQYARAEVHLAYRAGPSDPTQVTFAWTDSTGPHESSHTFGPATPAWQIDTGTDVRTRWVEMKPVVGPKTDR